MLHGEITVVDESYFFSKRVPPSVNELKVGNSDLRFRDSDSSHILGNVSDIPRSFKLAYILLRTC